MGSWWIQPGREHQLSYPVCSAGGKPTKSFRISTSKPLQRASGHRTHLLEWWRLRSKWLPACDTPISGGIKLSRGRFVTRAWVNMKSNRVNKKQSNSQGSFLPNFENGQGLLGGTGADTTVAVDPGTCWRKQGLQIIPEVQALTFCLLLPQSWRQWPTTPPRTHHSDCSRLEYGIQLVLNVRPWPVS